MIIDQPVVSGSLNVTGSSTFVGNILVTGSISATEGITISGSIASASYAANAEKLDGLDSTAFVLTSSYNVDSSSFSSRTSLIESKYATTGSNTFTGPQYVSHASNAISFTSTASLYTDGGLRVTKDAFVSGTLYLNNLTVYGTSSIQYITSSQVNIGTNIITVNTDTPAIRFGGLAVYDSGSTGLTGSILWDSEDNQWIYSNPSGAFYDSAVFLVGPRNSGVIGNEPGITCNFLSKGDGLHHMTSSGIFENGTTTCFYGGTSVITANSITSSQITANSFTGSFFGTASNSVSASYALTASYASNVPETASYALQALSSSYALTASYSANVPVTASYALQALSSSYALTASYISGSGAGVGFPFSGSAVITGSLLISNLSGSGIRYVVADENGLMTAQTASTVLKTTQTYTASAGQTTFSVTNGYSTGYVDVFINGSKLNDSEFTDTSGTDVLLLTASFDNDIVEVVKYLPAQGVSNNVLRTLTTFTAANSQSTYNVSYTPGLLDIFYNGSRLSPIEYTANNGTSFTLATASAEGDTLDVLVYSYQVGAYAGIGGSGQQNQVAYYTTTSSISGSDNFTFDGSTLRVTGSIITSGSSTFVNIGPTVLSGSLTVSGSITAVGGITISGSIDSASYASNAEKLDNLDSTAFVFTSSYNTDSGSFSTRVTKIEGNYATTGSNIFMGAQTVCANITSTGTIIAQTLNVQQVTSSIVYSSGSNIFGCSLANTQQFTGSVLVTGSLSITGPVNGTSTICSTGNTCFGGMTIISSCLGIGTSTPTGKVYINGIDTTSFGDRATAALVLSNLNGTATNRVNAILFGGENGSTNSAAGIAFKYTSGTGNGLGDLLFATRAVTTDTAPTTRLTIASTGAACFTCELTAKSLGTNDLILNNLNYECANYVDGTRGSWLIQEGACDLFIINQVSGKKYKFNLIEIK